MPLDKEEFLQQYVLTRVSHKKTLDELLNEAIKAWDFIKIQCK
jgi:hypothetical protein